VNARPKTKAKPKAVRKAKTVRKTKAARKTKTARKTKVKRAAKTKQTAKAKQKSKIGSKAKARPKAKAKLAAKTKPKAKAKAKAKTKTKTKTRAKTKAKTKARRVAKPKNKTVAKAKTKAQTKNQTAKQPKRQPKAKRLQHSKANGRDNATAKKTTRATAAVVAPDTTNRAGGSVPHIARLEYERRRLRLMAMMEPGSIALIPAARIAKRTRVTEFPFRQDSDFYYLTGFEEPGGVLVLAPDRPQGEVILFCDERDALKERWDGEILGPERATESLGLDDAFPVADMPDILPGLLEGRVRIYITLGEHVAFDAQLMGWVRRMRTRESGATAPPGEFVALKHLLHEMRLYKSANEVRVMQHAADISAAAHARAMRACLPGLSEGQLEAELVYEFMSQGARFQAYPCIVGGGANACVMHYSANNATLKAGDLVLIDAGAEYDNYASDITRTFPVGGKFNASQQAIYEVVLNAQLAAIEATRVGNHFDRPHQAALRALVQGLIDLRILKGGLEEVLENQSYRTICPSKTSHWLGIDVHDAGDYRVGDAWRELEPGMVITVEPGVYIPPGTPGIASKWQGMAVRIEDEVLITRDEPRVLTAAAPKTIKDIQATMRRKL